MLPNNAEFRDKLGFVHVFQVVKQSVAVQVGVTGVRPKYQGVGKDPPQLGDTDIFWIVVVEVREAVEHVRRALDHDPSVAFPFLFQVFLGHRILLYGLISLFGIHTRSTG